MTVEVKTDSTAVVVPAIFRGPRSLAAKFTDDGFHFDEEVDRLALMEPGDLWKVEGDPDELGRANLAVTVYRDDGTWAPGIFRGPESLAKEISLDWAAEQGRTASPASVPPTVPERHTRVDPIPLGTKVQEVEAR